MVFSFTFISLDRTFFAANYNRQAFHCVIFQTHLEVRLATGKRNYSDRNPNGMYNVFSEIIFHFVWTTSHSTFVFLFWFYYFVQNH